MEKNLIFHHLLIQSEDHEVDTRFIGQSELPGLIINGVSKTEQVADSPGEYDLVFGEPAQIITVINRLPQVEWV